MRGWCIRSRKPFSTIPMNRWNLQAGMLRKLYLEALIWFAFAIFVSLESIQLGLGTPTAPGSGFMPFVMAMAMLLLSLLLFKQGYSLRKEDAEQPKFKTSSLFIILSLMGYIIIFKRLGYLLSSFVLWIVIFKFIGTKRWLAVLAESILVTILSYIIFGMALGLNLPAGILPF
jgi:hypothetical protein